MRFAGPVADALVQLKRPQLWAKRVLITFLLVRQTAEIEMCLCAGRMVAEGLEQGKGLTEVLAAFVVQAEPDLRAGEQGVGVCLPTGSLARLGCRGPGPTGQAPTVPASVAAGERMASRAPESPKRSEDPDNFLRSGSI